MGNAANPGLGQLTPPREFANQRQVWLVGVLFAALLAAQAIGFVLFGTGRAGLSVALSILVLDSLVALACTWAAFRRAQGITALFWFLFGVNLVVLLVPTAFQAFDTAFGVTTLSDPTRNLMYCLYGAPILMMLFLPDTYGRARVRAEILLDLFQIAIVVGLIYSTFVFLPVRMMLPAEALQHDVVVSDEQSMLLVVAAFVRLQFARIPSTRAALLRLVCFLLVCAVVTFIGDWIDLHRYLSASAWFNLGWAIPQVAAGLLALTWSPPQETLPAPESTSFLSFLGSNLVLVTMLSFVVALTDQWRQAHGKALTDVAVVASLMAFAFRLALTQFHQQQEISRRIAAQSQLAASHQKIGLLLEGAQRQTIEITQISELGSLLQACASRQEVFRLIPERLRRLFPGASGSISLFNDSRNRIEGVAKWGITPADQILQPDDCWALRRGRTHAHPGGHSVPRCAHFIGDGPSVCIPLIANGATFGTLSLQNDGLLPAHPDPDPDAASEAFARRRQLAGAVAEPLALAIANLDLRESLRTQAVRDPLTGLYNRRYMQEFLERELHSARRKQRPVTVMMLDLDHFKRYNDNFGHSIGDRALAIIGEVLLRSVRAEDVACRYGGEEFALILPECSLQKAAVRAEEIRKRIQEGRVQTDGQPADPVTVSVGLAAFDETTDRVDLLLKLADDALYQAKSEGRNRVVVARPAAAFSDSDPAEAVPVAPISSAANA